MKTLLKILLFVPKTYLLGTYNCLNYGNSDQLLLLMLAQAIFIINVKCSKVTGMEDLGILIFFTHIMHYLSKLTRENLYLQSEKDSKLAKVLMAMLYRQNKENKRSRQQAKDIKRQIKSLGITPSEGKPRSSNTFVIQIGGKGKEKNTEIPKSSPIIELGENDYKVSDEIIELSENDIKYLEGGN